MILCWNVRGAAKRHFARVVRDIVRINKVQILVIMEPRISGSRAIDTVNRLGFTNYFVVDADGFSGGIWLLWNSAVVDMTVLDCSPSTITSIINSDNKKWIFTAVYASPNPGTRHHLWGFLDDFISRNNYPWLAAGDFNEIVNGSEKRGGSPHFNNSGFKQWIQRNALVDLGFQGPKYTWCKSPNSTSPTWESLDRGLCNIGWNLAFPDAMIRHLPKFNSDHCPLLIKNTSFKHSGGSAKPFRFQTMWLLHDDFKNIIHQFWNSSNLPFEKRLAELQSYLKGWNSEVFGNVFVKKRRIMNRLEGIAKYLVVKPSSFLSNLECQLIKEYNAIMEQEEALWKQKSRKDWLALGDKNTRYFHLSTLARRKKNHIEGLFDSHGAWVTKTVELHALIVNYFEDLFSSQVDVRQRSLIRTNMPCFSTSARNAMTDTFSDNDIRNALLSIGSFKAPGFDGFNAQFYKIFWPVCNADIISTVRRCFNECRVTPELNHTLITLIPKQSEANALQLFRPISLCTTVYKMISKLMVAKIRPFLKDIISLNQTSFVPGRSIHDNIIMAQEILHKFSISKGQKGFLAWKVDLSKAYDRLGWGFIADVLVDIGIPTQLRTLIMHCITSVSYQVVVNGELTNTFFPNCGLRQGDPISPYIFVMCLERLSQQIQAQVDARIWKPVHASRSGNPVSHLFFADDLLLFSEANANQIHIIKQCLMNFCNASGQKINFEKSKLYCSPNTNCRIANDIACTSGSPLVEDLGMYLGVPLIHTKCNANKYQFVVEKVQNRLNAWKEHTLSLAGRIVYAKTVLSAIPNYIMQTVLLPMKICRSLDHLVRNFIWGHSSSRKPVHLLKWDQLTRPKNQGGLGIKSAHQMNIALLAKKSWTIATASDALWSDLLKTKYIKEGSLFELQNVKKSNCSSTWRAMIAPVPTLIQGISWSIGNGSRVLFWSDHWVPCGPLAQYATVPLSAWDKRMKVKFYTIGNAWNMPLLSRILPLRIIRMIVPIQINSEDSISDVPNWKHNENGMISTASVYKTLLVDTGKWSGVFIWSLHIQPRVQTFLWLVLNGRLLTNAYRAHCQLTGDPFCPLCGLLHESIEHILRSCTYSKHIWLRAGVPMGLIHTFHMPLEQWLIMNLLSKYPGWENTKWTAVFAYTLWYIWKWRCQKIFQPNFRFPSDPIMDIITNVLDWEKYKDVYKPEVIRRADHAYWKPPTEGCIKLNVDGSCRNVTLAAGGLLRDYHGNWIVGFSQDIGIGQPLLAELWALFLGLQLAWSFGYNCILVESDSLQLVQLMEEPTNQCHPHRNLICSCKDLLERNWHCSLQHIFREANGAADCMAKLGHISNSSYVLYDEAPDAVVNALVADCTYCN